MEGLTRTQAIIAKVDALLMRSRQSIDADGELQRLRVTVLLNSAGMPARLFLERETAPAEARELKCGV